ncbi:MAG: hypothetical protein GEV06_17325 [Luteitalea sp.]|nr:hypothetical protein [Luteitalea sp.]
MSSRLVNVRLDEDRLRKVRKLRERGVVLADLVREAIDEQFEAVTVAERPRDVEAIMTRIFEQYPDPPGVQPRTYDVHDRREARHAIVGTLRRKR